MAKKESKVQYVERVTGRTPGRRPGFKEVAEFGTDKDKDSAVEELRLFKTQAQYNEKVSGENRPSRSSKMRRKK